jgi:hypothetical protein
MIVLFGAFFTNIEISTNRPTYTSWKIRNQPLIKWYHILGFPCAIFVCFYLVFVVVPSSTKKAKKNCTLFVVLQPLMPQLSFFSCFVEIVLIVVESCCWFGFVFFVCSTQLRAFGCATHWIPPIQQQINPLYSLVCPASRLVLILHVARLL